MKEVKFKIQPYHEREKIIVALANSGYKTWVVQVKTSITNTDYYVHCELK